MRCYLPYLVLPAFFFFAFTAKAQKADSLLQYARSTANDSLQSYALQKKSVEEVYTNPGRARKLARHALRLAEAEKLHSLQALACNALGITYDVTSQYDSSLFYYRQSIAAAQKGGDEVMEARALNNIGLIHWKRGDYDRAIDFYTQSLRIFDKYNEIRGLANTLNNIGLIYMDTHDSPLAIAYQTKALGYYQSLRDTYGISACYSNLGPLYTYSGKKDSAHFYLSEALRLKNKLNDKHGLALAMSNMGAYYKKFRPLDSATFYTKASLSIFDELGDSTLVASAYYTLGGLYLDQKNYAKAEKNLLTGQEIAKKAGARKTLLGIHERLATIYEAEKNYPKAFAESEQVRSLQNEIFGIEKERAINEIDARYQNEKKERQLAENKAELVGEQLKVKQRTTWAVLLGSLMLIVLLSAIYVYRQQRLKQQKLREESRLKEELSQAEIKNKIQEERMRISRDLHDHIGSQLTIISSSIDRLSFRESSPQTKLSFGRISDNARETMSQLRETIWAMNQEAISLQELVSKVREYAGRVLNDQLKIEVKLQSSTDFQLTPATTINLYRICQEAIGNGLKHAHFTFMKIAFTVNANMLHITLKDDGDGFNLAKAERIGNGLANMRRRAKEIQAEFYMHSDIGKGTEIGILLKLNKANYV